MPAWKILKQINSISPYLSFLVFYVLHLQHTSQHFIETSTQIEKYQAELRNIIQRQKEEVIKKQVSTVIANL